MTSSPSPLRAERVTCVVSLVVGAVVLGWSLSIAPGDAMFYMATALLACVWLIGAVVSQRVSGVSLRPGRQGADAGRDAPREAVLGVVVGVGVVGVFLVGALLLTRIPPLRDPVEALLDHTDRGVFVLVLLLALLNGWAEELFFRGALFDALRGHHPAVVSTLVYTAVTAASGIWMLAFAGLVLGGVAAWLRVRTGGVTASVALHLTWLLGMIVLLPPALDAWS